MSDTQQFIITCRFPEWGDGENTYPAFGQKYLIEVPVSALDVEWTEDEDRWGFDPDNIIVDHFRQVYYKTQGNYFEGEILFVEPAKLNMLKEVK